MLEYKKQQSYSAREVDDEKQQLATELAAKHEEIARLNLLHSCDIQQLTLQVRDLDSRNKYLVSKCEADAIQCKRIVSACNTDVATNKLSRQQAILEARSQITKERESAMELRRENQELQQTISQLKMDEITLKQMISTAEAEISNNVSEIERKDTELKLKTRALEEKESILAQVDQNFTRLRDHLATISKVKYLVAINFVDVDDKSIYTSRQIYFSHQCVQPSRIIPIII